MDSRVNEETLLFPGGDAKSDESHGSYYSFDVQSGGSSNGASSLESSHSNVSRRSGRGNPQRQDQQLRTIGRMSETGGEVADPKLWMPSEPFLMFSQASDVIGHGSFVAVSSLCANMLGGGIYVLPWAMAQAGVGPGIVLILLATAVLLYTCRLLVQRMHDAGVGGSAMDISDICYCYLGKWGERLSHVSVCLSDLAALAVQWIIISNFAYYSVALAVDPERNATVRDFVPLPDQLCTGVNDTAVCRPLAGETFNNFTGNVSSTFKEIWTLDKSVPAFVALLIFPLLLFRRPFFLAKLNSMVVASVIQVVVFLIIMATALGNSSCSVDAVSSAGSGWRFPAILAVVMFCMNSHRSVVVIMRKQRHPSRNLRDINAAFLCTALVYLFIGVMFVVFFPNSVHCTQQVFMDNFAYDNLAAFSVRVMVAIQLGVSFPLGAYALRVRTMQAIFKRPHPSNAVVFIFNCLLTVLWILVAQHLTQAADIVRYTGAIVGLFTQIILPSLCQMAYLKSNLILSYKSVAGHGTLILLGVAVVAGQFFVT